MSEFSKALIISLMLIGGSPGSTAGGMKTLTVAVLFSSAFSVFRNKPYVGMLKRRVDDNAVRNAFALFLLYVSAFMLSGVLICFAEGLPLATCLYETASAIGTVGLSLGITSSLGVFSKFILMILMFLGRVGGLTLIYATVGNKNNQLSKLPLEQITIG